MVRSTFPIQDVQSTTASEHFWKMRCWKSVRRCGAKHMSKSKCTKHTNRGPLLEVEMSKKCTPLWREAHVQVKNVQSTTGSDPSWKLRCRKNARCCGAKHISKSKCTKHTIPRPLLEVEMSKKCTPLWREANFRVQMYKAQQVRTFFGSWDVKKVHTVVARSTFPTLNVQNTPAPDHFWTFRSRKSARRCGTKHISKLKCTKRHMYGPLLTVEMRFCVAGARDCAPCQKRARRWWFCSSFNYNYDYNTLHYTTLQ